MTAALSYRSRALTALALALPIPLLAALGLSLPLPATVERLAARLVPFADHATIEATPRNGSIVPASSERRAGIRTETAPSANQGLIVRSGRVVKVGLANVSPAIDAPRSMPRGDAETSTTAAPESAPTPSSTTAPSQPASGSTEPQQAPVPTQPDPKPTPAPAPTNVVENTVTTIANTATTATNTAKTTVDGVVGGVPHP